MKESDHVTVNFNEIIVVTSVIEDLQKEMINAEEEIDSALGFNKNHYLSIIRNMSSCLQNAIAIYNSRCKRKDDTIATISVSEDNLHIRC